MPELGADILEYFRAVARGDRHLASWRDFMTTHAQMLERGLSRPRWLRLKLNPRDELPRLLDELGMPYHPAELDQRLRWPARGMDWEPAFGDSCGVRALYNAGRIAEADASLQRQVRELASSSDDAARGPHLGEEVLDAEALLDAGHVDEALGILLAVALLPRGDDLLDPAIRAAESVLRRLVPARRSNAVDISDIVAQLRAQRSGA